MCCYKIEEVALKMMTSLQSAELSQYLKVAVSLLSIFVYHQIFCLH